MFAVLLQTLIGARQVLHRVPISAYRVANKLKDTLYMVCPPIQVYILSLLRLFIVEVDSD